MVQGTVNFTNLFYNETIIILLLFYYYFTINFTSLFFNKFYKFIFPLFKIVLNVLKFSFVFISFHGNYFFNLSIN